MAQERLERLMNVIAYLSNTRRALTLREIIGTVPGYPDSIDAARRAFERDKEKLRSMNFDITVENTPDGQIGYSIRKENTYFDIQLTPQQRSIVEYALNLYGPEKEIVTNAVTKLGGMNPDNFVGEVTSLAMPDLIDEIFSAISHNKTLQITFRDTIRHVIPQRLIARSGYWYLAAFDFDKNEPRTFRVDRISSAEIIGEGPSIEVPTIEMIEDVNDATKIVVRVHEALVEQFCQSWNGHHDKNTDTITFKLSRPEIFFGRILEYSGFVAIISPANLKDELDRSIELARKKLGASSGTN